MWGRTLAVGRDGAGAGEPEGGAVVGSKATVGGGRKGAAMGRKVGGVCAVMCGTKLNRSRRSSALRGASTQPGLLECLPRLGAQRTCRARRWAARRREARPCAWEGREHAGQQPGHDCTCPDAPDRRKGARASTHRSQVGPRLVRKRKPTRPMLSPRLKQTSIDEGRLSWPSMGHGASSLSGSRRVCPVAGFAASARPSAL